MPETESQIDRNYQAFVARLPELLQTHPGKFALLHDEHIDEFFQSALAAVNEGARRFGMGAFSVQEVTSEVENLGFYSYAGSSLLA